MDTLIQQLSPILYDSAKQTGAIFALDFSGVKQKINFGDSTLTHGLDQMEQCIIRPMIS